MTTTVDGLIGSQRDDPSQTSARIGPQAIKDKYDRGVKATNSETQRYWQNLAFLQGDQWVYWSRTANRLMELARDESRVRITINRLGSSMRRLVAKSTKRPLVFEVPPTGADDATVRGARIAESILSDLHRTQNWELLREEQSIATFSGGTGLACLDWDPTASQVLETDETTGRVVATGDVKVSVLAVTEAVTEPGTKNIEDAYWWIKAQAIPAAEVQENYHLPEKPAADASTSLSPVQQKILQQDRAYQPVDLTLVLTYYERPSSKSPKGQVCTVVGSKIVDGPYDWPFPFKDRLNVVAARETKVLSRWTGDTILSQAVPVQTAYNAVWSAMVEHVKLAGNARILWPFGAGDAVDNLSDLPAEIVEYLPSQQGNKPEWWVPPAFPPEFLQFSVSLATQMDDILGIQDVDRGQAPRNIESGQGLAILAEQSETPTAHVTTEVANSFGRLASMILEVYADKVKETRTARVDYPHQVSESVPWSGNDLMDQTRAIVPDGAVTPVTKAEIWTKGINLYDRGAFGAPGTPQSAQILATYISGSGEENFIEATNPDVAKAQRENYKMALGEPELPADFDDHQVHIETLNTFRKSATFERLPDDRKNLYAQHAKAHEVLAAEAAAMAQNRQSQDMGAGQLSAAPAASGPVPAGAGQPPDVGADQFLPAPWEPVDKAAQGGARQQGFETGAAPGATEAALQRPLH